MGERQEESEQDAVVSHVDYLRQRSAAVRLLAESEARRAATFAEWVERGVPGAAEIGHQTERAARMMEQIASVAAAQAIAYDDMIAAGGPQNSRAYVEYEATLRRLDALLPTGLLTD